MRDAAVFECHRIHDRDHVSNRQDQQQHDGSLSTGATAACHNAAPVEGQHIRCDVAIVVSFYDGAPAEPTTGERMSSRPPVTSTDRASRARALVGSTFCSSI